MVDEAVRLQQTLSQELKFFCRTDFSNGSLLTSILGPVIKIANESDTILFSEGPSDIVLHHGTLTRYHIEQTTKVTHAPQREFPFRPTVKNSRFVPLVKFPFRPTNKNSRFVPLVKFPFRQI